MVETALTRSLDFASLDELDPSLGIFPHIVLAQLTVPLLTASFQSASTTPFPQQCKGCAALKYSNLVTCMSLTAADNSLVRYAANDFKLFAEREVPLELRSEGGALAHDAGSVEAIRVRVLVRGIQPDLEAVRV